MGSAYWRMARTGDTRCLAPASRAGPHPGYAAWPPQRCGAAPPQTVFFPASCILAPTQTAGALGRDVVRIAIPQVQPGAPGAIAWMQIPGWPTLLDSEIFTLTSTGLHAGQLSAQCRTPVPCRRSASACLLAHTHAERHRYKAGPYFGSVLLSTVPSLLNLTGFCGRARVWVLGLDNCLFFLGCCRSCWRLRLAPTNNTAAGRHSCNSRSSGSLAGSPAAALPPLLGRCPCRRQASWVWVVSNSGRPGAVIATTARPPRLTSGHLPALPAALRSV